MEIPKELVDKILAVLAHNIGDNRCCPICLHSYVPKDRTVEDTLEIFTELKKVAKSNA